MIFKYELKKILNNKVNMVAMLAGYIIMAITVILPVMHESEYVYKTDTSYTGIEAVQYMSDFAKNQTDYLTEEFVTGELQKLQGLGVDLESDIGFVTASDELGNLFVYLVRAYSDIRLQEFDADKLMRLDLSDGVNFYKHRIDRISEYLNMDFSYGNYTEAEKEYWISKAEQVTTPFKWGDTTVADYYRTVIGLGFYMLFVVIICVSPVFAGENESGASGIILATRHGMGKMMYAKLLASLVFSIVYVSVGYLASCIGLYAMVGKEGFDLPVQLLANEIPYEMTIGQTILLQMLVSYVLIFFTVSLILLISAVTKSSLGTMAVMLVILVGPAFIPFSKSSALFNHILVLTAVRLIDLKGCLSSFIDYKFGGLIVGLVPFAIFTHVIVGIIIYGMCRKVYIKRTI